MVQVKTKVTLTKEQKKIKKIITDIANILSVKDGYGHADACLLWNIVSALRGPDTENFTVKQSTTAKIRAVIGVDPESNIGLDVSKTVPVTLPELATSAYPTEFLTWRTSTNPGFHFEDHYRAAVRALVKLGFLEGNGS